MLSWYIDFWNFSRIQTASLFSHHYPLALATIKNFGYLPEWMVSLHPDLAAYFSVGCCFYIFKKHIRFTSALAVVASITLLIGLFSYRGHQLAFSLAGSYLLFYFAYKKIPLIENFGSLPDVSYGLYLYGWPIQKILIWNSPSSSPWTIFLLSAILAIFSGLISWSLIEKRFIKPKREAKIMNVVEFQ